MSLKDCIEHLYSWDYTIKDSYGCPGCTERERIIKMLEEAKPLQATDELEWGIEQAIALIKGENK